MNTNRRISRKAILIGCPGSKNNFLEGVTEDLKNVCQFLKSDKGGAWYETEINTIYNPTLDELCSNVHSEIVDYLFVYFSGHGYTNNQNERMLCLRNYHISDKFLLNGSPRQLILIDACRNYFTPGISGIPDYGEQWEHFDGVSLYHDLFDEYILNSPSGSLIIHATQKGMVSYDSHNGGYFTQAVLNIATRIKTKNNSIPVHITKILPHVLTVLRRHQNNQVPSITYRTGNLTIPFALYIPSQNKTSKAPLRNQKAQSSFSENLLGVGLVAVITLGVIAIFSE
jgi:hypothetical protein